LPELDGDEDLGFNNEEKSIPAEKKLSLNLLSSNGSTFFSFFKFKSSLIKSYIFFIYTLHCEGKNERDLYNRKVDLYAE
jgi:hypothetical protein